MKKLSFFLAFFLFSFLTNSFSFKIEHLKDLNVDNEPVGVFFDNQKSTFHIICAGTDRNFDGIQDSTDVIPTWWIVKLNSAGDVTETKKVSDFPFASIPFPFRPAFVESERTMYINHFDGISAYNIDTFEPSPSKINLTGASLEYFSGHLLICQTNYSSTIDTIIVYSINQKRIMAKYPVGKNLFMAKSFQPENQDYKGLLAISVGTFGQDSSMLHKAIFGHFDQPKFTDLIVGNTANYLDVIDNRFALVTVMMSNKLVLTDLLNENYSSEIFLGEPGWDGPAFARLFKISENNNIKEYLILIASYDGTFTAYKFLSETINNGYSYQITYLDEVNLNNKAEAFDTYFDKTNNSIYVIVANSFQADYSPNKTISILKISDLQTNVMDKKDETSIISIKNSTLEISKDLTPNTKIEIFDLFGNKIIEKQNLNSIDLTFLPSGTYFIKISDLNNIYVNKFTLVK